MTHFLEVSETEISDAVSKLYHTYRSGKTRSLSWRIGQLRALQKLIAENTQEIEKALFDDLGKCSTESQMAEISFSLSEIKHTLKHLKKWTKARRKLMPISLQPATGKIIYEPLGTVLIISPWNYPFLLLLTPLIGAVAAGNTVLLKPSEVAINVSRLFAKLIPLYLDQEAIKVIETDAIGTGLILKERFDYIFYTGNEHVGKIIMEAAAKHLTPVTLELGGKSPVWIDDTVDIQIVAKRIAWAKFLNAGQTCIAPDYILTTNSVAESLISALKNVIESMYGNDPKTSQYYSRIINVRHTERLHNLLSDLDPDQIIIGGEVDKNHKYISPTVIDKVSEESKLMEGEIFGPLLPIVRIDHLDDAIDFINKREKPLALYAYTNDKITRERFEKETSSGALDFNVSIVHLTTPQLPFGGVGYSGMGAYHGKYSFKTFSHLKPILSKPLKPDTMQLISAPYGKLTDLIIKWFL